MLPQVLRAPSQAQAPARPQTGSETTQPNEHMRYYHQADMSAANLSAHVLGLGHFAGPVGQLCNWLRPCEATAADSA